MKSDVPMMLRVVEREAQTLSQQKHTLRFEVDDSLSVLGNEEQLRSAIQTPVYNAVNHTPAGTQVTVSWRRKSRTWRWSFAFKITVRDCRRAYSV